MSSPLVLPRRSSPIVGGPVVLVIMDGIGWGRRDEGDAVAQARTPTLLDLMTRYPTTFLAAHGKAVGLPSDDDMGNSEVGHNALGAGRIFDQGARLVDIAIEKESLFLGGLWRELVACPTLHLLGLVSDGNVHSHIRHIEALIRRAHQDGVRRLRLHALTDGRDVPERSALTWILPLEAMLAEMSTDGRDYRIASGGGRMSITMDRYEADWAMVKRGWDCHVFGSARPFASASGAIRFLYDEDPRITDQTLPAFVITETGEPVGRMVAGDALVFFNFRGDRAIEISKVAEGRVLPMGFLRSGPQGEPGPELLFAGMMQYDGDLKLPRRYLVEPPAIDRPLSEYLVANGISSFVTSETQKFGHVTYFFNGNRSGLIDPSLEHWLEIPSDLVPFDQKPEMKAAEIAEAASDAIRSGLYRHVRLNFANGDMVGHTGDFAATVRAVESVDRALARVLEAVIERQGVMLLTADHGNADQMFELHKKKISYARDEKGALKVKTSHSLNPVPLVLVDPLRRFDLNPEVKNPVLANITASLLHLLGLQAPKDYLPSLLKTLD